MTFRERYQKELSWHGRVIIMEIYHLAMNQRERRWTITKTAKYFNCSIGLASENLNLAKAIHTNENLLKCESRQEALNKLNGSKHG